MATSNISQDLWSQFTEQISSQMGAGPGNKKPTVQAFPAAQLLYAAKTEDYQVAINNFAAVIPQWQSIYVPSQDKLIQAYQIVLTQIKETATNEQKLGKEYTDALAKLKTMMGKASNFKVGKIKAYVKTAAVYTKAGLTPPAFAKWFENNGLEYYNGLLDDQTNQQDRVKTLLEAKGLASPLVEALAALNEELKKIKKDTAPKVTLVPDASIFPKWKNHATDPEKVTLEAASKHYDYSKTVWQSQTGTELFGFISIGHHTTTHTREIVISDSSDYKLEIDFAATATLNVSQESWLNDALLRDYKKGPWVKGSQFGKALAHPYGQDGVLPLAVTRMFVVMNPTIKISMKKEHFDSFYDQLNGNYANGVNLGPFACGGDYSHHQSIKKVTNSSAAMQTVQITDKSNVPQIIAIDNEVMP